VTWIVPLLWVGDERSEQSSSGKSRVTLHELQVLGTREISTTKAPQSAPVLDSPFQARPRLIKSRPSIFFLPSDLRCIGFETEWVALTFRISAILLW